MGSLKDFPKYQSLILFTKKKKEKRVNLSKQSKIRLTLYPFVNMKNNNDDLLSMKIAKYCSKMITQLAVDHA
jgi:DNA gyrase/topoisomerase IV subunit A